MNFCVFVVLVFFFLGGFSLPCLSYKTPFRGPGDFSNRRIRLTQCGTQLKSPGFKILCVLYLHYNVAFTFK